MSTSPSKLDALANLIRKDGADPKPTLLRVLTDFYVQKRIHSLEENAHFTELALRLIDEVDSASRADIARRLDAHGGAPEIILRRLTHSTAGEDMSATSPGAPFSASVSPATMAATPISSEISAQDRAAATGFSEQFFAADGDRRRAMLRELDDGAAMAPLEIAPAEGKAACRVLEAAALRSRPYEFVREMERALAIPRTIAQAIVNDTGGEPMLVVARALGMTTDVVQRILLLVNPAVGTSVRRVFELSELYEKMSSRAALRLISLWRYSEQAVDPETSLPERDAGGGRRPLGDPLRRPFPDAASSRKKQDQRAS